MYAGIGSDSTSGTGHEGLIDRKRVSRAELRRVAELAWHKSLCRLDNRSHDVATLQAIDCGYFVEDVQKEWQKLSKSKVAVMIAKNHLTDSPTTNKKMFKKEKKQETKTISSCFQFHQ